MSLRLFRHLALSLLAAIPLGAAGPASARFAATPVFSEDFAPGWESTQTDWKVATWMQNDTQMSPGRCRTDARGLLVQTVLPDGAPPRGGSLQTNREFGYGRWIAHVKPSSVPGVLNSIFTKDWDDLTRPDSRAAGTMGEVDIEFLTHTFGPGRGEVHLAIHVRQNGKTEVVFERDVPLDFNPSDDFREWGFDILPDGVVWHVDGREIGRWQATPDARIGPGYEFFLNSWTKPAWIKGPPKEPAAYLIDWVKFFPLSEQIPASIRPTSPPSLAVRVDDTLLSLDPPEIREFATHSEEGKPVADHRPAFVNSDDWPGALRLTPKYDATGTLILGGFFRTFRPETLRVTSDDGTVYQRDRDFVYHEERGLVANLDGRLRGRITARAEAALQRLDLIQLDADGRPSVKKGESAWLCPALPEPDAGQRGVAGVYIAPWRASWNPHYDDRPQTLVGATEYAISAKEIFPIDPAPPAAPLFPENLAGTLAKLRAGQPVTIAFLGDSITLGAEATRWWEDRYDEYSTPWKGRLIHALRTRFPGSAIEVIEAYRGGTPIAHGLEQLPAVLAQKPDLLIVAFGANDADGPPGGPPRTSAAAFAGALAVLANQSRAAGAEILFVTAFPLHPWLRSEASRRLADEHIPALKRVAREHGAAVADVHADYLNLDRRGIPHWSQNHNWTNHPGDFGHRLYAETLLRCFAP